MPAAPAISFASVSLLLLAATSTSFAGESPPPSIIYVDDDAPPAGDGLSWPSAFRFLADALAFAAANPSFTQVRIAQGTYTPDRAESSPLGSLDRSASFLFPSNITILGGYFGLTAAGDMTPDSRNPLFAPTILSGDLLADDDFSLAPASFLNHADNAFHVASALNISNTTIDGLVFTAGYADGQDLGDSPASANQGAALNIFSASLALIDCTFSANFSARSGAVNDHGSTSYAHCVFSYNFAGVAGAGLFLHPDSVSSLSHCRFDQNLTPLDGAGAFSAASTPALFSNCLFQFNHADRGAGLFIAPATAPAVFSSTFQYNTANFGAGTYVDTAAAPAFHGGMWCQNSAEIAGAGINNNFAFSSVNNAMFAGNDSAFGDFTGAGGGGGSGGGGFWSSGGAPSLHSCSFSENFASFGAGFYANEGAFASIARCSFSDNTAGEGAGAYLLMSSGEISDSSFTDNHVAGHGFAVGGAISNYFSLSSILRCTFIDNSATLGGGAVYNEGSTPSVTSCFFLRNAAHGSFAGWGGALLNSFDCSPSITNCAFVNNHADQGGAIFNTVFSWTSITNCTLAGNFAIGRPDNDAISRFGGGLFNSLDTGTSITNSIIAHNAPNDLDGLTPAFAFSIMPGIPLENHNRSSLPAFSMPPGPGPDLAWMTPDDFPGELSLASDSPAIDAGDNSAKPLSITSDVANLPRFVDDPLTPDTGSPALDQPIDIGAFEFQPNLCSADIAPLDSKNLSAPDGVVDFLDLSLVILAWGTSDPAADINHDLSVNIADLSAVILHWGPCR